MKYLLLIICLFLSAGAFAQQAKIPPVNADALMKRASGKDTIYVINFWATWCAPCVKELPVFDTIARQHAGEPVKVLLVSFDFKDDYLAKISAFIKKKHPVPEILWFSETNANEFIPKIDNRWGGALPATLVIRQGYLPQFTESTVTVEEVESMIENLKI